MARSTKTRSTKPGAPKRAAKKARPTVKAGAAKKATRKPSVRRSVAAKPAARKTGAAAPQATRVRAWVERDRPEALRLRSVAAGLTVADLARSPDFYTRALGFFVAERWERDGVLAGVMLKAGVCELGLSQDDWKQGRERIKGVGVRIWCETRQDLDLLAARVRACGFQLTEEPADMPWGVRAFSLDDPDGFHLTFCREGDR